MAKTDSTTGNTFGEEFAAQRRAGAKTFMWGGKEYNTEVAKAPTDKRTTGRTGFKVDDQGGSKTNPRDAEAGTSRGMRNRAGAGRGGQGGASMDDVVAGSEGTYDAGAGRGIQGTALDESGTGYKRGGRVTGYKGYGKARKV